MSDDTESMTLANRAGMAKLSIAVLTAVRNERSLADETADRHGVNRKMISTKRATLARTALKDLNSLCAKARNFHYSMTLPWLDEGGRVLPAKLAMAYITKMREFERDFFTTVDNFVADYPEHVKDAKLLLNGTFDPTNYPGYDPNEDKVTNPELVRGKFSFKTTITNMPSSEDFRIKLGDDEQAAEEERIRKKMLDNDIDKWARETASRDLFLRIYDRVKHMVERLKVYHIDEDGKVRNKFHDSVVINIEVLCELIPLLNITNDQDLVDMADRLKTDLCEHSGEVLRKDSDVRAEVTVKAEDILKVVEGFLS